MTYVPSIVVRIVHIHGGLKGEIQEYFDNVLTVGRLPVCTIKFPAEEPGVSREHARIQREGNQFRLIDLSKFGTSVNGKPIKEAILKSGDVLEFGPGGPKLSFLAEFATASILPSDAAQCQAQASHSPQPPYAEQPGYVALPVPDVASESPKNAGQQGRCPYPAQKISAPLVIQFGPTIRTYRELPVTVGADARADFVLSQPGILGQHGQILFYQAHYFIKDLTGRGLISVNNRQIDIQQLATNDEIELCPNGPKMRFLGEGRLAEIDTMAEQPFIKGQRQDDVVPNSPAAPQHDNLLSKLARGLRK
jgi:pSer/pThr/pTyr-binding forkhead associated (FHA) protein